MKTAQQRVVDSINADKPDDREINGEIDGERITIRLSGMLVAVEDRILPAWLEIESEGQADNPSTFARVEVRDNVPRLVELGWRALPGQREVQQKDLRATEVSSVVEMLFAGFVIRLNEADKLVEYSTDPDTPFSIDTRNFLVGLRSTGNRRITTDLLKRVAAVYRENIEHAPTQAVAARFGVKPRQASVYVDKARQRGFLPPTKQGKKQA